VLAVNVGSSSVKLSLVEEMRVARAANLPNASGSLDSAAISGFVDTCGPVDAVAHRIVHGGDVFKAPVVVDSRVREQLGELVDLAPLHQPRSLAGLDLLARLLPDSPSFACFDTAFHATIPLEASTYALPAEWRQRWAIRRYGFHGLSHAWSTGRAADLSGRSALELRIVTCHLGAGASLAAVSGGVSVDTTMGFTPLEGLVMATRSGSVDPGLLLWLEQRQGMTPEYLASMLEHESGLLGLAGTSDMKALLERRAGGDGDAELAVDVYVHRLRALIAAMVAAMNGIDVLVFTGGVGERSSEVRHRAAVGLSFLGVALDESLNAGCRPDAEITAAGASVRTFVVEAHEDIQMASELETTKL